MINHIRRKQIPHLNMINKNKNPWSPEDEGEHIPSIMEWWCAIAFLKTVEDNKKWSFKGSFAEWFDKPNTIGCVFNTTFFDKNEKRHYTYTSRDDTKKLEIVKGKLDIKHDGSYLKGLYPNYKMFFHDTKNDIKLDLKYEAKSLPHWIAQDVTNGWLPMGLGFYRYGYIPKCKATGELTIKNKTQKIVGEGYYEHVWGDIWYDNPVGSIKNAGKTLSVYTKLVEHWIKNQKFTIPNSLKFANENNPFGYDWSWALLDNGWTIYYGNFLFWLMDGPMCGLLILSKDGETYNEFWHGHFHYNKIAFSKKYDFCYPREIELTAEKGKEKIHLIFKKTAETREYVSRFKDGGYWQSFVICEAPGIVEGSYTDGEKTIKLSGICKIEPQRQVSTIGHNSLDIKITKPPKGVGLSMDFNSHYFKKKISSKIQLAPIPKINFKIKRISKN